MQAINYPAAPASPVFERFEPDPIAWPEPTKHHRPPGRVVAIGGGALILMLAGFLIGRLPAGRQSAPNLPDTGPSGFAEMYVSTLLTQAGEGTEDVLVPYLGYSPDLTGFEPGTWYVTQTAVWSVEPARSDGWTVLVAAAQLGLQDGGYVPAGTFFYEVNVEQTSAGLRATALPTLVATPLPAAHDVPGRPDIDESLAGAVAGFLTEHFTEWETTPFETPPFDTVIVRSIVKGETDGDHLEVGVEFIGVDAHGRATPLAYRLQVSTVDWSIETGDLNRKSSST